MNEPSDMFESEGLKFIEAIQDLKLGDEDHVAVHVAVEWGSRALDLLERIALALESKLERRRP